MPLARLALVCASLTCAFLFWSVTPSLAQALSAQAEAQIQSLMDEKASRTPAQQRIDSNLLYAFKMRGGGSITSAIRSLPVGVSEDAQGLVKTEIRAEVSAGLLQKLERMGCRILHSSQPYGSITADIPLAKIEQIADIPGIQFIRSWIAPVTNVGSLTSQGDAAHQANLARAFFGTTGAGVKIGVLSDGVDGYQTSIASGDLPPTVTILPGQAGPADRREGRAMMEIIHDLAPGAQLFYATAVTSQASFAENIANLRFVYGCDIIVDDVLYLDEGVFQDGAIARAVDSVTVNGALYFSSAGNFGNKDQNTSGAWEGDFKQEPGAPTLMGGICHNFGTSALPQYYDVVTSVPNPVRGIALKWSDPLTGSANDYDLYILDATGNTIIAASNSFQNGQPGATPYEAVYTPPVGSRIVVVKAPSAAARALHIDTLWPSSLSISTDGVIFGHMASPSAIAVAAVAAGTGAVFNSGNQVEGFSSDGPRRQFYDRYGTPLTPGNFLFANGGASYQKPDITAADGVATTTPGFSPFFGTSAAAPHAAAIAALLKSRAPTMDVVAAMRSTAIDIAGPGPDRNSGYGIVMPLAVLQSSGLSISASISESGYTYNNQNGVLEPGEAGRCRITVTNNSSLLLTNLVIQMSSTSIGVTPSPPLNVGSMAGGQSFTSDLFFVLNRQMVACGDTISLDLVATYSGGTLSPQPFRFTTRTGTPLPPITGIMGTPPPTGSHFTSTQGLAPGVMRDALVDRPSTCADPASSYFDQCCQMWYHDFTFQNDGTPRCISTTLTWGPNRPTTGAMIPNVYNNQGHFAFFPDWNFIARGVTILTNSPGTTFSYNVGANERWTINVANVQFQNNPYTLNVDFRTCQPVPCSPFTTPVVAPTLPTLLATVGAPVTQTFSATGGSGLGYRYVLNTPLPPGLTFTQNGTTATLEGYPTAPLGSVASPAQLIVTILDATGCGSLATGIYNIAICQASIQPTSYAPASISVPYGGSAVVPISITNPDLPYPTGCNTSLVYQVTGTAPWAVTGDRNGFVLAGPSTTTANLNFNASGLAPGTYAATLYLQSNAANAPSIPLQYSLTVACPTSVTLASQAEVDAFDCTSLTGSLNISGPDITNLAPLAGLTQVGGSLTITACPLSTLDGLNGLLSVGVTLTINSLPNLTSISGLNSLTSAGNVVIDHNPSLACIGGLSRLRRATLGLFIHSNDALTGISGLSSLLTVGHCVVYQNPQLTTCCGLAPLFAIGSVSGLVSISGNGSGCNSASEIAAGWTTGNHWASSVVDFSSEFSPTIFSAQQALGPPNLFPLYADAGTAWASATPDGQPEYLTLGFPAPMAINFVRVAETWAPDAVSSISVRNPNNGLFQQVWSQTPMYEPGAAKMLTATFPEPQFLVSQVRIDLASHLVPDWNEIDAVSIGRCACSATLVDAPGPAEIPLANSLGQPRPNPFRADMLLDFALKRGGLVRIEVFNVLGQRVARLQNGWMPAGKHQIQWNGRDLDGGLAPNGVYFLRYDSADLSGKRRIVKMN